MTNNGGSVWVGGEVMLTHSQRKPSHFDKLRKYIHELHYPQLAHM